MEVAHPDRGLRGDRMKHSKFIAARFICAAAFLISDLSSAPVVARDGQAATRGTRLAFLSSGRPDSYQPVEGPAPQPPQQDVRAFDGSWLFTSTDCGNKGFLPVVIKSGKIIVRNGSGNVSSDGILHSVGAGGGLTQRAEGRLYGDTGSGTFDRSDGCSGNWIAIRKRY
jgi:hypothetical protein